MWTIENNVGKTLFRSEDVEDVKEFLRGRGETNPDSDGFQSGVRHLEIRTPGWGAMSLGGCPCLWLKYSSPTSWESKEVWEKEMRTRGLEPKKLELSDADVAAGCWELEARSKSGKVYPFSVGASGTVSPEDYPFTKTPNPWGPLAPV